MMVIRPYMGYQSFNKVGVWGVGGYAIPTF